MTALLATLDGLRGEGIRVRTLIGHSQGGLLIQMAQQRLIDEGSDLRQRFRIRKAILLASVGSAEIPWFFVES